MARTLVIKNADFSANKVITVTFIDDIPCTGISFESSTITITGYETETVEYTLIPANTTDVVIWQSSNTNIITVDDGVLTPVGIGTCILTATCGDQTATATVTVSIACTPKYEFAIYSANTTNNYVGTSNNNCYARLSAGGKDEQASTFVLYGAHPAPLPNAIMLPKNTIKVKVAITDNTKFDNSSESQIVWGKNESAGFSTYENAIKLVSAEEKYNITTETDKSFTVPSNVDCFVFATKLRTTYTSSDDPNDVAASAGLTITFLAE